MCVLSVFHATKSTPLSDPEAVSVVQGKDRAAKSAVKAKHAQWKEDRKKAEDNRITCWISTESIGNYDLFNLE